MNLNSKYLWPSSLGLLMIAFIIIPLQSFENSTLWIPFCVIFTLMGILVFLTRNSIESLENRIQQLEILLAKDTTA